MARPWPLPAGSVICQVSHNAAPGSHAAMAWFVTPTLIWLAGNEPSTGMGFVALDNVGKFRSRAINRAVRLVPKVFVPVGSTQYEKVRDLATAAWRHNSPVK